ncbi:XrtN system VIT domain-containing protein [Mucilaginibacter sp. ZT4R22]|uniref:XrtN system VIT domain-containing protein n=1 Tax=Mucilaginibacter pankratovii TaxID=2772110 RepID=A0ABR7WS39_9SPHI|nr:XrtN system VIT domain-containing protein [Mucilaginibacter pankratovii]MBD1365061.1 XrtN system VIT domain-containing protein [Mucilaginibacter pankratovii]
MKNISTYLHEDKLTTAGLGLIAFSAILFVLTGMYGHSNSELGAFAGNYLISIGFLLALWVVTIQKHGWRYSLGKAEHTVVMLVLWFISAFALNREMNVFDDSTDWLSIWIVASSITLLLAMRYNRLSGIPKYFIFFLLGGALLLFTYYAFYLLPLYLLSVIGILAIGISLHTFVPLYMGILTVVIIIRASRADKAVLYTAIAGFVLPLIAAGVFLFCWNQQNKQINLIINQNTLNEGKLPAWVAVSRAIDRSPVAERILKAGLVYHEVSSTGNFFFGGMPSQSFDERKQHDPLVVLATLFFEKPNLDETERINILKAMYNSRHQAQDRLWSGDMLQTISVISNVKLYPEYRLAYTEKTLSIRNNSQSKWSNQEAIYTFHLPEGSVISSLSLWINGKEEKSRLTTKAKADSAYKTIVGVERHDPSVVHWQEGNTISVRVFPCGTEENRKFRIGITSPLRLEGKRLVYENAWFDGPFATSALETLQLSFSGKPINLDLPAIFKQKGDTYTADRPYEPGWKISCDAPPLANTAFAFADTAYRVSDYQQQYENFAPSAVYLDVNRAWTAAEFKAVYTSLHGLPVYVYYDKLIKVTDGNLGGLYETLGSQNFSLFPLNEIRMPESALLITKGGDASPNLGDLEGSGLAADLTNYLKTPKHIRLYNIGSELTPYLKALKELRVFGYADGTTEELSALLNKHQFVRNQENDSTVVIDNAGLIIQKAPGQKTTEAPDHLLRLFAYNDIMKKVGADYFRHDYVQPQTIAEAEQGYIVSPVSSMIVLETAKDYERFGIDENKNSLKNASMKSSGAVPEPQEWMLIILAAIIVGTFIYKRKKAVPQW